LYPLQEAERAYAAGQYNQQSTVLDATMTTAATAVEPALVSSAQVDAVIADAVAMEVDPAISAVASGTKRKAEEDEDEGHKRVKTDPKAASLKRFHLLDSLCNAYANALHRDRENCTVFVANLPPNTTEDELTALFRDVSSNAPEFCGVALITYW
jgi:squamous cell carcinoma antigen recognized by T-cells 3